MNKAKKNIVIVGFNDAEKRSIDAPPIGDIIYLDKLDDLKKHQGYLLIIDNKKNIPMIEYDKKYRKYFNKYAKVWLYNEKYDAYKDKFSNIELVYNYIFNGIDFWLWEEWDEYKELVEKKVEKKIEKTFTKKRLDNINKLYNYLKNYKTIKTVKICNDLNINARMVQRYMSDVNDIYHNIGYDYSNNEWYITK